MLEALARQRDRQIRAVNVELAVHGLSAYGLVTVIAGMGAPAVVSSSLLLVAGGLCAYRWIEGRRAVQSLHAAAPKPLPF